MASISKNTSLWRENAPSSIALPLLPPQSSSTLLDADDSLITPRAAEGSVRPATTPGLSIAMATPHINGITQASTTQVQRPVTAEEGTALEKRTSHNSQSRSSTDRPSDYFSSMAQPKGPIDSQVKGPVTPGDNSQETMAHSPVDADKEEKSKEGSTLFGKKFRMNFPKKLGRSSTDVKPTVVDEKSEESDKSDEKEDRTVQDNLYGTVQKIRYDYEERLQNQPSQHLPSGIIPIVPSETPMLRLPPSTSVIIQEEGPDSGGVADLYRGTVGSVGRDADLIEKAGPMWLGELLLKVRSAYTYFFFYEKLTNKESNACKRNTQSFICIATVSRGSAEHCKY